MKSSCSQSRRRAMRLAFGLQAALMASNLVVTPVLFAADLSQSEHQHQATPVSNPSWAEALKGQTRVEDALEGRAGRSEKVELQHHRLMQQMEQQVAEQAQAQWTSGGYNGMSMMHQYMGQDGSSFLLMSDNKAEPVSMSGGIEKVRAEEAKNKAARDKEMDPGAVSTGLQGDWIQPLVIRGNQGDCVKITLRNQMESEAGSLHIHGSSTLISVTGKAATTTNPDSVVDPGKTVELEWYLHPGIQEGVRQFHSYSNDRELTVMGLFGAFVVT